MKILKPGRKQNGWATKATCTGNGGGGCGAQLLVEQGDLYRTSSSSLGETDYFVTFRCTACGVETDLKNVPSNIEDTLRDRPRGEAE
jgi:mevalonate kinase